MLHATNEATLYSFVQVNNIPKQEVVVLKSRNHFELGDFSILPHRKVFFIKVKLYNDL